MEETGGESAEDWEKLFVVEFHFAAGSSTTPRRQNNAPILLNDFSMLFEGMIQFEQANILFEEFFFNIFVNNELTIYFLYLL